MKKLVALLLCLSLIITSAAALAAGIGTPEAPVKVTWMNKDVNNEDADAQAVMTAIEQGMAAQGNYVDLEIVDPPAGKYVEVVPLAFRTGELNPDIIYFQGNTDGPMVAEGLLQDLTSYIEGSAHVKNMLGEHSKARLASQPYLLWLAPAKYFAPVMRADVLEKAATTKDAFLADPTPDNYYALLKELTDNGTVKMGVTVDGGLARLDSIFNQAFGVSATIVKDGDKWVYAKVTEAEKNKLAFYAKLYADGLLDPDYITKAWDTMEQAFYDGDAALIAGTAGDVIQVYNTKMVSLHGEGAALVALPPAKGVGFAYTAIDVSKEERGFAINASSAQEVKDAAFAVLDYMASPEGRMLDKLGVQGTHYTLADNNVTFTEAWGGYWARFFPTVNGLPAELTYTTPVLSPAASDSLTLGEQYYAQDTNVILPEELAPLASAISAIYTEYANEIVRGVRPIDDFAEMVEKINAAGGDQLSEYFATVLK